MGIQGEVELVFRICVEYQPKFVTSRNLERLSSSNDDIWQYPINYEDQQPVDNEQILPVKIISDWDHSNDDRSILNVLNVDEIQKVFNDLFEKVVYEVHYSFCA